MSALSGDPWAESLPNTYGRDPGEAFWEDFGYTSMPEWVQDECDLDPDTFDN